MKAWSGTLAFEDRETDDGRMIAAGALVWPVLPIALLDGDSRKPLGRVTEITREGNTIRATGEWSEDEEEIGLAIEIGSVEADFRMAGSVMVVGGGRIFAVATSENPSWPEARMDPSGERA
ncbi:hypothetical protein QDA02_gp38 [Microbacterium phage Margaery]|uniref:Uncharacterized protein n=1 Tax=Microbacterium phage Margaery TaxID=2591217 RepID=A0A514DHQ7_9CAUD|nr:hypothetical protein QDA02_gp38 [Microbacterium phage Margaery]QDH93127.1 hypothetical protein PBI_MARGAERY_70 [Microbacterium phage Margaery]